MILTQPTFARTRPFKITVTLTHINIYIYIIRNFTRVGARAKVWCQVSVMQQQNKGNAVTKFET